MDFELLFCLETFKAVLIIGPKVSVTGKFIVTKVPKSIEVLNSGSNVYEMQYLSGDPSAAQ